MLADSWKLLKNPNFVVIALSYGIALGTYSGWSGVLAPILSPLHFSQVCVCGCQCPLKVDAELVAVTISESCLAAVSRIHGRVGQFILLAVLIVMIVHSGDGELVGLRLHGWLCAGRCWLRQPG